MLYCQIDRIVCPELDWRSLCSVPEYRHTFAFHSRTASLVTTAMLQNFCYALTSLQKQDQLYSEQDIYKWIWKSKTMEIEVSRHMCWPDFQEIKINSNFADFRGSNTLTHFSWEHTLETGLHIAVIKRDLDIVLCIVFFSRKLQKRQKETT